MRLLRGFRNRIFQVLALYSPGGTTVRVWLHRRRGVTIGEDVFIGTDALIETERPDLVAIGSRTAIGIRVVIIAHFLSLGGVEIGDDVFIGPGSIVMPNVRIGNGAVVAAGSVVTKSVPDLVMVRGNPAEPIARCGVPLGRGTRFEEFMRNLQPIRRTGSIPR